MEAVIVSSESGELSAEAEGTTVVQVASIGGQPIQVQAGSLAGQPSVIKTPSGQIIHAIQVTNVEPDGISGGDEDAESRKRREVLARRPSYRKILNDLSGSDSPAIAVARIEEESNESMEEGNEDEEATNLTTSVIAPGSVKVVPAGSIQIAAHGDNSMQGLQTLTMTNAAQSQAGATIVQCAQGADGQIFIPAGNLQYQIAPSSLSQSVVMGTPGSTIANSQPLTEESARKRELRLLKNREAARECRRKKKDYVKCLENRVAVLENQNKTLIEELKSLKELYCQKEGQS